MDERNFRACTGACLPGQRLGTRTQAQCLARTSGLATYQNMMQLAGTPFPNQNDWQGAVADSFRIPDEQNKFQAHYSP